MLIYRGELVSGPAALPRLLLRELTCEKVGPVVAPFDSDVARVVAGPCVIPIINGDVARVIETAAGGLRIEWWVKGTGWTEAPHGAFTLADFMPGYTRPILPKDRARLEMPPLYDTSTGAKLVHLLKARAWDLAARRLPPGHA